MEPEDEQRSLELTWHSPPMPGLRLQDRLGRLQPLHPLQPRSFHLLESSGPAWCHPSHSCSSLAERKSEGRWVKEGKDAARACHLLQWGNWITLRCAPLSPSPLSSVLDNMCTCHRPGASQKQSPVALPLRTPGASLGKGWAPSNPCGKLYSWKRAER